MECVIILENVPNIYRNRSIINKIKIISNTIKFKFNIKLYHKYETNI
jgi:hypothetical protein